MSVQNNNRSMWLTDAELNVEMQRRRDELDAQQRQFASDMAAQAGQVPVRGALTLQDITRARDTLDGQHGARQATYNMTATAAAHQMAARADSIARDAHRQALTLQGINGNTIRRPSFDRVWLDEADSIGPNDWDRLLRNASVGTISGAFEIQPRVSTVVSTHQRDALIREGWTPPGQENSPYSRVRNDLISKEGTNVEVRRVFDAMAGIMWLETVETLALHMTNKCEQLEKQLAEIRSREAPRYTVRVNNNGHVDGISLTTPGPVEPQFQALDGGVPDPSPPAFGGTIQHRRVQDPTSPLGYRDEIIREELPPLSDFEAGPWRR